MMLDIPENQAKRLRWALTLAALLFLVGIFLPMLTITKLVFFQNSFSVVSGIVELLHNGQYPLFVVLLVFSVILPLMKIGVLYRLLSQQVHAQPRLRRYLDLMHDYGRWAMLDVMVVAILIVTVKLGVIASIEVHIGLYLFGAAVLLIMFITHRIVKHAETGLNS